MIISCKECNKKFEIDEKLIPNHGRMLQCGYCNHSWFFKKEIKPTKTKIIKSTIKENIKPIPDNTKELINEAEAAILIESKKIKIKKPKNILSFLIIFIITIIALIILADTFKNFIMLFIPNFDLILNNLYESLEDIVLFFKDLVQ